MLEKDKPSVDYTRPTETPLGSTFDQYIEATQAPEVAPGTTPVPAPVAAPAEDYTKRAGEFVPATIEGIPDTSGLTSKETQEYLSGEKPITPASKDMAAIAAAQRDEAKPKKKDEKKDEGEKAPSYIDRLEALLAAREGRLAEQREQDKNLAILAAGLGILSGKSPYAAQNIGAGALKGLEQYGAARKATSQEESDILSARLGQYRYGEESRLRAEDRSRDQGMRLASLEEKRIRDEFTSILGNVLDPRNKQLTELIKRDPNYVDRMAIEGRNRILQGYGIDIGDTQPIGSSVSRDYSKWGQLNVGK
jgi:hypothetical protein